MLIIIAMDLLYLALFQIPVGNESVPKIVLTHTRLTALCPGLPRVSRYQKGTTNLDFTEAKRW